LTIMSTLLGSSLFPPHPFPCSISPLCKSVPFSLLVRFVFPVPYSPTRLAPPLSHFYAVSLVFLHGSFPRSSRKFLVVFLVLRFNVSFLLFLSISVPGFCFLDAWFFCFAPLFLSARRPRCCNDLFFVRWGPPFLESGWTSIVVCGHFRSGYLSFPYMVISVTSCSPQIPHVRDHFSCTCVISWSYFCRCFFTGFIFFPQPHRPSSIMFCLVWTAFFLPLSALAIGLSAAPCRVVFCS